MIEVQALKYNCDKCGKTRYRIIIDGVHESTEGYMYCADDYNQMQSTKVILYERQERPSNKLT